MSKSQSIITGFDPDGPFAGLILPPRFRKRQSETRFKQRWNVTLQQYWLMMREGYEMRSKRWLPMPGKQRGSIILATTGVQMGGASGVVQLSTHTKTSSRFSSGTTTARFDFESDGQLWGRVTDSGGNTQYAGEWWSTEPQVGIGPSYEVRNLSAGKTGVFSTQAAADNVWITINGTNSWTRSRTVNGSTSVTATYEVGPDGVESADDSAVMTLTAVMDFL